MNDKNALDMLLKIYYKRNDLQGIFPVAKEDYQSLINWADDVSNNKFDDVCYDLFNHFFIVDTENS